MSSWLWPFWPLSTWQALVTSVAIFLVLWGSAILQTALRRGEFARALRGGLQDFTERYGPVILTVPGNTGELWLCHTHVHLYGSLEGTLIATAPLFDVTHLKIIDQSAKSVTFGLRLRGEIDTPALETTAIARFANLFQRLIGQGKQVLYLQR
jgi:hypothetical protein